MIPIQLRINSKEVYTCEFAGDDKRAITGAQKNLVQLWDVSTGSCLQEYPHPGSVWALAWSADQERFLSVDGTLRLWEVEAGRCLREYEGHSARCVAWSDDEQRVLAASGANVRLLDAETGEFLRVLKGHADGVYCVAFDADQRRA